MGGGDGVTLVMITHEGTDRWEVQDVLQHRWPDVAAKELQQEQPTARRAALWVPISDGAVEVPKSADRRHAQQDQQTITAPSVEPMPVLVVQMTVCDAPRPT